MQLHAEEAVSAHMANPQEEFSINQRIIKRSFVNISCRNSKDSNQAMKSSNRWAVMKSLDKRRRNYKIVQRKTK
jgi:penicillin-binding protein 1A